MRFRFLFLGKEIRAIERENERLRAALAQSELPCAYCSRSREDWARCDHGFPGCPRADDANGCPMLWEAMSLHGELEALRDLRPLWAQGYTSDSVAAQASAAALSQIWKALGVSNQTQAMERIRQLNGDDFSI